MKNNIKGFFLWLTKKLSWGKPKTIEETPTKKETTRHIIAEHEDMVLYMDDDHKNRIRMIMDTLDNGDIKKREALAKINGPRREFTSKIDLGNFKNSLYKYSNIAPNRTKTPEAVLYRKILEKKIKIKDEHELKQQKFNKKSNN